MITEHPQNAQVPSIHPSWDCAHADDELRRSVFAMVTEAVNIPTDSFRLTGEHSLSDLGLSSLRLIGLIVALEEVYGLDESALAQLTPGTTLDRLLSLCAEATSVALPSQRWAAEA